MKETKENGQGTGNRRKRGDKDTSGDHSQTKRNRDEKQDARK